MSRITGIAVIMVFLATGVVAQINWVSWDEAVERSEKDNRKILVDIYTEWCGWCKKMDKATFGDIDIADYVNQNFYAVKLDAEQKSELAYKGKMYKFVGGFGRRGYHELAAELMNGRLSYPTVVFLDEDQSVIQPIPGYQDPQTFEMIMIYFAEDHYKSVPWQKFMKIFKANKFSPRNNIGVQPVKNN